MLCLRGFQTLLRSSVQSKYSCGAVRHYEMGDFLKQQTDHHSGTMTEVTEKIRERTGVERGYHVVPKSRDHLLKFQPKKEDLPTRSMQDSYTRALLPLGSDELARERYINHLGRMRMGRLMEELDMFAVWLCHRHVLIPDLPEDVFLPYTFVTLLVDRVDFENTVDLQVDNDVELSGFISWTGSTSMEVTIYSRQMIRNNFINITKAVFLMVARNATNTGPAPVNSLKPANEMEEMFWKAADERQKKRRVAESKGVLVRPPKHHEQDIMFDLLRRTTPNDAFDLSLRKLPLKSHWMDACQRSTIMNPFPENRNAHNTIFGGFIMRQAVELSFITASIFTGGRPILKCISDISFMKPVKVTAFLQMTAYIVYTKQSYVQIMTVVKKQDVYDGDNTTTNVFYLTYSCRDIVDEVMPGSYREMLWYINGRRKFQAALKLLPETKSTSTPKAS